MIIFCITLVIFCPSLHVDILIKIRRPTNPCNISIIVFLFKLLRGLSVNEMLLAWITLDMNKVVTAVQHIAGPEQNTS